MMRNGDKLPAKMVNCRLRNMTIANADPLDSLEIEVWHNGPETDPLFHNVCNKKHKVFLVRDLPASCTITLWRIFFPVKANLRNFAISFITCRCLQTQLSWRFVFWTAPSSVSVAKTMRTITVHVLSSVVKAGPVCVCSEGRGGVGCWD